MQGFVYKEERNIENAVFFSKCFVTKSCFVPIFNLQIYKFDEDPTSILYLTVVNAPEDELYPAENGRNRCVSSQVTLPILCRGDITNLHKLFDLSKLNG